MFEQLEKLALVGSDNSREKQLIASIRDHAQITTDIVSEALAKIDDNSVNLDCCAPRPYKKIRTEADALDQNVAELTKDCKSRIERHSLESARQWLALKVLVLLLANALIMVQTDWQMVARNKQ
jgi:hypothetical protein